MTIEAVSSTFGSLGFVDELEYLLMVTKGAEHFEALHHLSLNAVASINPHWQAILAIKKEILATKTSDEAVGYDNFARRCKVIYDNQRRKLQASDDTVHSET